MTIDILQTIIYLGVGLIAVIGFTGLSIFVYFQYIRKD